MTANFHHLPPPKNQNIVQHSVPLGSREHLKACLLKISTEGFACLQKSMISVAESIPARFMPRHADLLGRDCDLVIQKRSVLLKWDLVPQCHLRKISGGRAA